VVVGLALRAIDPARQLSTALLLVMPPLVALIVVGPPGVKQVASPVLVMETAAALLVFQVTAGMVELPNVLVPVAANCWVAPTGIVAAAGDTVMAVNTAAVQVRVVLPLTVPLVAVICELPVLRHCATPLAAPMVATVVLADDHVTELSVCDGPEE